MARTREVFPTEEIPHKWAHQAQAYARNPQGNFRFTGNVITSYSTDIGQIHRHKTRGALVLISEHRYSNTTARQLSHIAQAVRHMPHIYVPQPCPRSYDLKAAHAKNLAFLLALHADSLAKAQRAQTGHSVRWLNGKGAQALTDAGRYSVFFGIRRKVPAFPAEAWQAAEERAKRIENPDPASLDARERASARRAAATADKREYLAEMRRSQQAAREAAEFYPNMARRTDWRLGGAFGAGDMRYENYGHRSSAVMLRVSHEDSDGEQIETSQGARIPLAAAPLVWAKVQRALGKGWQPSGLCAMKIGDYALDGIDADGTLRAGCHVIPHSELRSMARALNLGAA